MAKAKREAGQQSAQKKPSTDRSDRKLTSEKQKAEFRAHYLLSGNASESAEAVGMNDRTGRDLAAKLSKEESFADDRRALRATFLEEHIAYRMRVTRKSFLRFNADDFEPMPGVVDRRPDYGKLVLDAEKNAHNLAKVDNPLDGQGGTTEVHVHLAPTG
jgi:hypothetical protein